MGRIVAAVFAVGAVLVSGPVFAQKRATQTQGSAQGTAQGTGQAQFNYGGISQQPWFSNQGVRKQLGINEDQYNRLNKTWGQNWTKYNTEMGRLSDVPENQRYDRLNQSYQTFNKGFTTSANEVLTPEQQKRYNQLYLQYQGYNAFNDPTVQQKLNLTEDQKEKLRKHSTEMYTQQGEINSAARTDRQGASKRFDTLRQRDREWTNSFLTPQQQQSWRQMTGEPYEFSYGTSGQNQQNQNQNQNQNKNQNQQRQ